VHYNVAPRHFLPIANWDEQDSFTAWRHVVCIARRAGFRKATKRAYNRRQRRALKNRLRKYQE